jgi:hypothetical protein
MPSDDIYQTLIAHMERQNEFQNSMSRDMGELKATQAALLAEARKTNGRVTALEQFRWKVVGYAACLSTVFSAGAVFAVEWAKSKFFGS